MFYANREQAIHRLQEARHGSGDVDMIGILVAMAQFDAVVAKEKIESEASVKINKSDDTIEKNQE